MVTNETADKAAYNDRVRWSDGAAATMTKTGETYRNDSSERACASVENSKS
ncbi:hypothetical protein WN51_11243 [Melipona quadrifasciata]|uniref:Uncharacterized protein n=1 Tax=Melipona quadrifasciata TaxID=166423 RepID=A0A0M9A3Q0_9HYME|nr:hypothetical protein WN51_11243 [Melipona quadrifasciata]